ncbi:MAG: alpha/beta hydrolase [Actinomycetota bacterium]|nr:alpha/beta hydrolase [Actinomycetota bacterium]
MRATWFGRESRPLFGWLHSAPSARAGAVLCLPIGDESFPAYRAYGDLAERLEAAGVSVVRFDYSGTGNSAAAPAEVVAVEEWLGDVRAAADLLREDGVDDVTLVGIRSGALLAEHAATAARASALVLWDPVESGRRWLREVRLLGATGVSAPREGRGGDADGLEIPGILLGRRLAEELSALALGRARVPDGTSVLVLERLERPVSAASRSRLEHLDATWGRAVDMPRFFDVDTWHPFLSEASIARIEGWVAERTSRVPGRGPAPGARRGEQSVGGEARAEVGPGVRERAVRIGPSRMFGVLTEPSASRGDSGLRVLFVNTGLDRHIGPSRLWVDLARRWAADGSVVLRVDVSGTGDSPARPSQRREVTYSAWAVDDVVEAATFLAPEDPGSVVLVGTCSGAYHAIEAGVALRSRAVWAVNPAVPPSTRFPGAPATGSRADVASTVRRATRRANPFFEHLAESRRAVELAHSLVPGPLWSLLDRLGLYAHAASAFRPLLDTGASLYVRCGKEESQRFLAYGRSAVRRLERTGRLTFEVDELLDHTLLDHGSQVRVAAALDSLAQADRTRRTPGSAVAGALAGSDRGAAGPAGS